MLITVPRPGMASRGISGTLRREGRGECCAILWFLCGSLHLCRLRTVSFWPWWQALICTDRMSSFLGSGKPSRFCNYFFEPYLPASRWFVGGGMRVPTTMARLDDPRGQDLMPGARAQVWLSRDLRMIVVRETREAKCMMCYYILPLQGVYRFESPRHSQIWVITCPLLSSRSMSCCTNGMD
jgi:hypothetical protein